jgi:mycothiol synthase
MVHIELRTELDAATLAAVRELVDDCTRIEGHRPVGEHKYAHLAVGAPGWTGALAFDGSRLVGYAHLRWNASGHPHRMAVEVVVHPQWRSDDSSIARRLLEATRAVMASAGGGVLFLWVHRVEDARATLAARMGFAVQRELAFMRRDLDEAPAPVPLPEGVVLRAYRPEVDDEALLAVNNAAFAAHPENGGWDVDELAARRARDWFDPDDVLMAWRGTELVGFHWTKWHGHDSDEVPAHEPVGEVYVLAVAPSAQGLGLGRALLVAGLRHLHGRRCRQAVLYVDCASEGAVRLYQRHGFATAYREVCYVDDVPPARAADLDRPA